MIVRKLVPFPSLLDSLVMVPLALPGIVLAFGYVVTYSDTALDPLNNPIPLLVIAYAIRRLPYMVRSAVAGLQQTSISLEEASETFGASRFHTSKDHHSARYGKLDCRCPALLLVCNARRE